MEDGSGSDRRRILLVRGGVLSPHSGLGGAFHDLRTSLEGGHVPGWSLAGVLEYDLGPKAPGWRRLWQRWVAHPRRVRRAVRQNDADLVMVTDQEQAHLVPNRAGMPVLVYVHDAFHLFPERLSLAGEVLDIGEQRPSIVRRLDLRRLEAGLRRADGFVCNTRATEAMCTERFAGISLDRVPYGVEVGRYAPPTPLPAPPVTLAEDRCHFLVVGSHDPRKRLGFLIRTLAALPHEVLQQLRIHHIGGDACPYGGAAASELAASAGVPWQHVGSGISDEILNAYRWHTQALLFPSGAEGFGYPPVESMAAGQPVVVSDRPAHNELVPEGTAIDPEDESAWRAAVVAHVEAWAARKGTPRPPDDSLIAHVAFLAPERFHQDMAAAWDRHVA